MIKRIKDALKGLIVKVAKWPFQSGKKTARGFIVLGVSVALKYFADYLPHDPSAEEIELIVTYGEQALQAVAGVLEIFGLSLAALGLGHKATKKVAGKPQDPSKPQW